MIKSAQILKRVYKEVGQEITTWGTGVILKKLGFNIDRYSQKIDIDNNQHMFETLIKTERLEKIVEDISQQIDIALEQCAINILENDILPKVISTTQQLVIKQAQIYVEQVIYDKLYKNYKTQLEERLTKEVMSDPQIQEIMISKL